MAGYRGRLIFPFKAEIFRLSQEGTDADPDAGGPLTSGYDPILREPILLPADGVGGSDRVGAPHRVELAPILLPCQIEDQVWESLMASLGGDDPRVELTLIFHFEDLERLSLVDSTTGDALIRKGDRLGSIRDFNLETVVQAVKTPPGLYAIHVQPRSYGLSAGTRNLLAVVFRGRDVSTLAPG